MFLACRSARDRLTLLLLSRVGLRPGQAAGLRRTDPHLMMDSRSLGCDIEGAHMHVVRRQNENGAWSKSRKSWVMPVDFLVVQAFDQYVLEHNELLGPAGSDFLLVNLFRPPFGTPVTTGALGEMCESLSRRAGLGRLITPRMCRHAMASNVADAGGKLDEVQALLGQKHPESARPYLHPSRSRLRDAVERVSSQPFRTALPCPHCPDRTSIRYDPGRRRACDTESQQDAAPLTTPDMNRSRYLRTCHALCPPDQSSGHCPDNLRQVPALSGKAAGQG